MNTKISTEIKNNLYKYRKELGLISTLILLAYVNSLGNIFISDDVSAIANNSEIDKFSYVFRGRFLSLRNFFIYFTHKLGFENPWAYRLQNIFLHIANGWLVFFLVKRFFTKKVALLTASIFAVHPMIVESVTWISGGLYPFYTLLILLSFIFYLRAGEKTSWTSVALYGVAILASEKAVALLGILIFYEFLLGDLKSNLKKISPYFVLTIFWTIWLYSAIKTRKFALQSQFGQELEFTNPFIQLPLAVISYIKLFLFPKDLSFYHAYFIYSKPEFGVFITLFILFLGLIFLLYLKNKKLAFFSLFFLIMLSPTLLPVNLGWLVAERYAYAASIGIITVGSYYLVKLSDYLPSKVHLSILIFLIGALFIRTVDRNMDWRNRETLWTATAKTSPYSPKAHNNMGDVYIQKDMPEKAVEEFKKAISIDPDYPDAHHNLANTYQVIGETGKAVEHYKKAFELNPYLWQSHQNLGGIYFKMKEFEKAEEEFLKALEINPNLSSLHSNLGIIYLQMGAEEKAREKFHDALRLDPQNKKAHAGINALSSGVDEE